MWAPIWSGIKSQVRRRTIKEPRGLSDQRTGVPAQHSFVKKVETKRLKPKFFLSSSWGWVFWGQANTLHRNRGRNLPNRMLQPPQVSSVLFCLYIPPSYSRIRYAHLKPLAFYTQIDWIHLPVPTHISSYISPFLELYKKKISTFCINGLFH